MNELAAAASAGRVDGFGVAAIHSAKLIVITGAAGAAGDATGADVGRPGAAAAVVVVGARPGVAAGLAEVVAGLLGTAGFGALPLGTGPVDNSGYCLGTTIWVPGMKIDAVS